MLTLPIPPDNITRVEVDGKQLYAAVSFGAPFLPPFVWSSDGDGLLQHLRSAVWTACSRALRPSRPFPLFGGILFPVRRTMLITKHKPKEEAVGTPQGLNSLHLLSSRFIFYFIFFSFLFFRGEVGGFLCVLHAAAAAEYASMDDFLLISVVRGEGEERKISFRWCRRTCIDT